MMDAIAAPARIGIIGLGSMGRPMGRNLVRCGYTVSGYDISAAALAAAADDGIAEATGPSAMAEQCDVVLIMVWDDQALRSTVFGPGGLLEGNRIRGCAIDLSTTSVTVAHEVGQAIVARGGVFLDGAVIGGGVAAVRAGKSPIVLAGDRAAYERCLPVFAALGTCDYVGDRPFTRHDHAVQPKAGSPASERGQRPHHAPGTSASFPPRGVRPGEHGRGVPRVLEGEGAAVRPAARICRCFLP